mmetsp:Transcript_3692/g.9469  ORF Transcript_3692/g.9469 Transcript_3692/m.9469 type:complete len:265 (-) Transcript_3692:1189-1983(-)
MSIEFLERNRWISAACLNSMPKSFSKYDLKSSYVIRPWCDASTSSKMVSNALSQSDLTNTVPSWVHKIARSSSLDIDPLWSVSKTLKACKRALSMSSARAFKQPATNSEYETLPFRSTSRECTRLSTASGWSPSALSPLTNSQTVNSPLLSLSNVSNIAVSLPSPAMSSWLAMHRRTAFENVLRSSKTSIPCVREGLTTSFEASFAALVLRMQPSKGDQFMSVWACWAVGRSLISFVKTLLTNLIIGALAFAVSKGATSTGSSS